MLPNRYSFFVLFILSFLVPVCIYGQENSLTISVKDSLDGLIQNADVTLFNQFDKYKKKTNKQGIVIFSKLEEKEYEILISHKDFLEYKSKPFSFKSNESKTIEVKMEIPPIQSEIDVNDEDSVHGDDYGMVTIITKEQIENLPDDPVEFITALRRIAGQSITGDDLPINVNGLEGMDIPPKELIDSIRIDRNTFSAKHAGTGGGGIEIRTSSQVTKFRGSSSFNFADSRLNAGNPFIGRRLPSQSRNYRVTLFGPLGKKTSFSLSISRGERDSSVVIDAITLDSNLNPIEYKETFPTVNRNHNVGLMINSDFSKKHRVLINLGFSLFRSSGQGVGGFSLPERGSQSKQQSQSLGMVYSYMKSDTFVNRTRFSSQFGQSKNFGENDLPAINVSDSFFSGGSPLNSINRNTNFSINNDTTHQWRKISFEYGFGFRRISTSQDSRSNFNGTYTFSGRLAPLLNSSNSPIFDETGNFIMGQITSLESYRRTLLFRQLGYSALRIRELGGGADQFSITGGTSEISASQYEYDLYFQGSYNLRKNLGLNLGLRYENQNNIKSSFNLAPRFSLIWSPQKKDKENILWSLPRVSTGVGLNYSRFGLGNILSVRQTNEDGRFYYLLSMANAVDPVLSSAILDAFPNVPSVSLLEQLSIPRSLRLIDDNIQTPYSFNSNLTLNKKMPLNYEVVFSISYTRSFRQQLSNNINAPLAGTYDPLNPSTAKYPFERSSNIFQINSNGKSESLRYSTNLRFPNIKLLKQILRLDLGYSFLQSKDNSVPGSSSSFDAYDFRNEFALSSNDGVHTLIGNFGFSLPFKFNLGGNWAIRNGSRFNITTGRDSNGDGVYSERPSFASDPNKPGIIKTIYGLLDPNPSFGDLLIPRNLGRGPKSIDFNMNLSKQFLFGGDLAAKKQPKHVLNFSVFASNIFNINNRGIPIGNMASPRFVSILADGANNMADDFGFRSNPRSFNFNVTFSF